jgi:sulfate permease, SulP family
VVLALRTIADSATLHELPIDHADHGEEEHALLADRIVAYRPAGPLFFGAADRFLTDLADVGDVDVVILRCSGLTSMDATGARMLGEAIARLQRRGIVVLLSGVAADHLALLRTLAPDARLPDQACFTSTPAAIAHARGIVLGASAALAAA